MGQGDRQVPSRVPAVEPAAGPDPVEVEVRHALGERDHLSGLAGRRPQVVADAVHESGQARQRLRIAISQGDHVAEQQLAPSAREDILVRQQMAARQRRTPSQGRDPDPRGELRPAPYFGFGSLPGRDFLVEGDRG